MLAPRWSKVSSRVRHNSQTRLIAAPLVCTNLGAHNESCYQSEDCHHRNEFPSLMRYQATKRRESTTKQQTLSCARRFGAHRVALQFTYRELPCLSGIEGTGVVGRPPTYYIPKARRLINTKPSPKYQADRQTTAL